MPVMSAAQMASFRALKSRLAYHDTFDLLEPAPSDTDTGGWGETDTVVATGRCSLQPANAGDRAETLIAERLRWVNPYLVSLPLTVLIKSTYRITVNGRRMEIGGVVKGGALAVDQTLVCREIQ